MCLLALVLPLQATERSELSSQIRRLKRDMGSLQVLSGLGLSAAQKTKLIPIVREAVNAEVAQDQSLADLGPEMLEAYGDYKVQAQRNAGSAQDVLERTGDCHRLEREVRNQLRADVKELERQVRPILTPDQLAFVENYSPRGGGRPGAKGGRGGPPRGQRTGPPGKGTPISRYILCPAALEFLDPQAEAAEMPLDKPEVQAMMAQIRDLESDIGLLNLMNGLNLTTDQMQQIASLAREAAAAKKASGRLSRESLNAEKEALLQAKKDLLTNGRISPATRGALRRTDTGPPGAPRRGPGRIATTDPALARWVDRTEALLTEAQREVLAHLRPCLVPPDPERAGQAETHDRYGSFIEHLRGTREERVPRVVEQFVTGEERKGKAAGRTAQQRQARVDQLLAVIRKARAMSDTEFAIQKDELAVEARPAKSRSKRVGRDPTRSVIENYLLNERIIPLLSERLKSSQ